MNFWKKLPLYLRIVIVAHVAGILLVTLLVLSMCGGVDEANRQIEQSNVFSVYFDIEADGKQETLTEFNERGELRTLTEIVLIAKTTVKLNGVTIETDKLPVSTNAAVTGNDVTENWQLKAGEESHVHTFDVALELEAGEKVTVGLSDKINLLCVFVTCESAEDNLQGEYQDE